MTDFPGSPPKTRKELFERMRTIVEPQDIWQFCQYSCVFGLCQNSCATWQGLSSRSVNDESPCGRLEKCPRTVKDDRVGNSLARGGK